MDRKSVGLIILWWSEMIISIRILLFSIPVMINKCLSKTFTLSDLDDRFIGVVILTALFYFAVGVISVSGNQFSKAAHRLAVVLVLILTIGSLSTFGQSLIATETRYASPLLFSIIITALNGILGKAKKAA